MNQEPCQHLKAVEKIKSADSYQCDECVKTGDSWVHLRTCQTCGATLCCNSSPNQHATTHFEVTGHAVTASAEPGERWLWCYIDEMFGKY